MSDGLKYTAASLADIAGMFEAKAETALPFGSGVQSASAKCAARREAHVWRTAAEILRNTTITSSLPRNRSHDCMNTCQAIQDDKPQCLDGTGCKRLAGET